MNFLEDRDMTDVPSIPEFYTGKTIFMTGGTGFMGKVLIEKLLYSCPELDRIYLLMREKKGVSPEDRLAKLYETECYNRLKKERPGLFESKVFVVSGDVTSLGLGLSQEDRTLLVNRVNIIFHSAASVRFDDHLHDAVRLNVRGTREMLELASEIKDLYAFVHVSTSYCNTNRDVIEEVLYPPLADWRDAIEVCENLDQDTVNYMTPKYLGEMPNTYVFTKQLAEHAVNETAGRLPAMIMRPSIVISSIAEPMPGWIENFNGPVALIVAAGKGLLRTIYCDTEVVSDYMPVDACIRSFITAAWIRGTKKLEESDTVPIYNCCTSNLKRYTLGDVFKMGVESMYEVPLNQGLWYPGGAMTKCKTLNYLKVLLLHVLPAIFIDTILRILGKKPLLLKIQRRIYIANLALRYYLNQEWKFDNYNFLKLRSSIHLPDKNDFYYDIEGIDVSNYFFIALCGGRKYLLKEKDEDIGKARTQLFRMMIIHYGLTAAVYTYLFVLIFSSSYFQSLCSSVLSTLI